MASVCGGSEHLGSVPFGEKPRDMTAKEPSNIDPHATLQLKLSNTKYAVWTRTMQSNPP